MPSSGYIARCAAFGCTVGFVKMLCITAVTSAILCLACADAYRPGIPQPGQFKGQNIIAAFDFNVGAIRGNVRLVSDLLPGGANVKTLEDLRGQLHFSEEVQYQLQMITKQVLEAFGLYEPFRKKTKAITLNNPVYYGVKSGMVNYLKNIYKGEVPTDAPPPPEGFNWQGIDGTKPSEDTSTID